MSLSAIVWGIRTRVPDDLTVLDVDAGALVVAAIDEEEVRVGELVSEQQQDAFQRPGALVHDVAVEKVEVCG